MQEQPPDEAVERRRHLSYRRRIGLDRPLRLALALLAVPVVGWGTGLACLPLLEGIIPSDPTVPQFGLNRGTGSALMVPVHMLGAFLGGAASLPVMVIVEPLLAALALGASGLALLVHGGLQLLKFSGCTAYLAAGAALGLVYVGAMLGMDFGVLGAIGFMPGIIAAWTFWAVMRPDRLAA